MGTKNIAISNDASRSPERALTELIERMTQQKGIAVENGQPILTRTNKHFSGMPGLRVEDY